MSEPSIDWYIHRIKVMLGEIDKLVFEETMTNSIREIISHNTNEIEINLHTIIRKTKGEEMMRKDAIDCGCTPRYSLTLELDPNPNGLPVLWIYVFNNGVVASVPLNRKAVSKLLVQLSQTIGEM